MSQPDIPIEYGVMSGRYFTQWRIDELKDLLRIIVFGFDEKLKLYVSEVKIWYDDPEDFHMLSYRVGDRQFEVRLYKAFSAKIDGVVGWQGCPRHQIVDFADYLRMSGKEAMEKYSHYGYTLCQCNPGICDRCKAPAYLYFGNTNFFDSREGDCHCGQCLDARIAADVEFAKHVEDCIEKQADHEAGHMPWML